MHRRTSRRLIALAVAYAVALNVILPLLPAFAPAAEAGAATPAQICGAGRSGERSGADLPSGHGPDCPFGLACSMPDCTAAGFLAVGTRSVLLLAPASTSVLRVVRPDDAAFRPRDTGTPYARAPPPA
jgi:hypothetical protein